MGWNERFSNFATWGLVLALGAVAVAIIVNVGSRLLF
jgi:hypothetical protein